MALVLLYSLEVLNSVGSPVYFTLSQSGLLIMMYEVLYIFLHQVSLKISGRSKIKQFMSLDAGSPFIRCRTEVWNKSLSIHTFILFLGLLYLCRHLYVMFI